MAANQRQLPGPNRPASRWGYQPGHRHSDLAGQRRGLHVYGYCASRRHANCNQHGYQYSYQHGHQYGDVHRYSYCPAIRCRHSHEYSNGQCYQYGHCYIYRNSNPATTSPYSHP